MSFDWEIAVGYHHSAQDFAFNTMDVIKSVFFGFIESIIKFIIICVKTPTSFCQVSAGRG